MIQIFSCSLLRFYKLDTSLKSIDKVSYSIKHGYVSDMDI